MVPATGFCWLYTMLTTAQTRKSNRNKSLGVHERLQDQPQAKLIVVQESFERTVRKALTRIEADLKRMTTNATLKSSKYGEFPI